MSKEDVAIGRSVRPEGSLAYGTIGCLARKDGVPHIVTCDHVVNTLGAPEEGPVMLFPLFDSTPRAPIGVFQGLSLASPPESVADLAAAPLVGRTPKEPSLLPAPLGGGKARDLTGVVLPTEGAEVHLWGARTGGYHSGRIIAASSRERLPHPKYGPQVFELQVAIQIDPSFLPEVGDSGGPILSGAGELVGFLSGGPLACRVEESGRCIAFGVPAHEALERLGLVAMLREEGIDEGA